MGGNRTAQLLADQLQGRTIHTFKINNVSRIGGIQFDGQAGGQIHAEGIMWHQHNGIGRNEIDQAFLTISAFG